jgi:RTX calcium-binding nonapeptide repeat (4 copies)
MTILTVGANQQYGTLASAIAASHDGDTIYVQAGNYLNDFATINTKISIVGVGGMAHLTATQQPPNGKAILVTTTDVKLDHIEFSDTTVQDGNGAGIRYEGGSLAITNSYFHDNQDGILAAPSLTGAITIDRTEFSHNGAGDGSTHNLYVGEIGTLQVTNSYLHDAVVGHEFKSRAHVNIITDNRIFDNNSDASYSIDLPQGGATTIKDNIIQQGPNSQNSGIIAYSAEAAPYAGSSLLISNNTVVNQSGSPSAAVLRNYASGVTAQISNNQIFGLTAAQIATIGPSTLSGNAILATAPALDTSRPWAESPWDRLVSGGAGNDTLSGSAGLRDLFVGGGGNDTINIKLGGGSDTVADFVAGAGIADTIHLDGYSLANFAAVQAAMTQIGADTVLALGGGETLTFLGVQKTAFAADDFGFANTATPPSDPPPPPSDDSPPPDSAPSSPEGSHGGEPTQPEASPPPSDDSPPPNTAPSSPDGSHGGEPTQPEAPPGPDVAPFALPASGTPTHFYAGTSRANTINGSNGNDSIDGRGGGDTMRGGLGDDTYYVDRSSDRVDEKSDQGIDTVISTASSYRLASNVENLILSGHSGHRATGNALDNLIIASDGRDIINAGSGDDIILAGTGAGSLTGGSGHDMFVFTEAGGMNRITDFDSGQDLFDMRAMFLGYAGSDPVADGLLAIASDGHGGLIVSADPTHSGTMHAIADVQHVSPGSFKVGVDLLWH